MYEHPIEGLMTTAMDNIKNMVDVNTIIGEPIEASNNVVIIPISKVCFGFAAGGSEFNGETIGEYSKKEKEEEIQYNLPFGGGAGAGVNIAFLVVQGNGVKLLPVEHLSSIDKLLDYMPDLLEKANNLMNKAMQDKKEEKNKVRQEEIRQKKEEEKQKEEKRQEKAERVVQRRKPKKPHDIVYEYAYEEQPSEASEENHIEYEEFDKYEDE